MSVPATLLRILARFPKLFIAIVKRCSSTALRLLQYIFSFLNASVQKLRERKHFAKSNVDNSSPSSKSREAEAGANAGSMTILCSPDSGHSLNQPAATTDTRSRPADGQGSKQHTPHTRCCQPPLRKSMTLADRLTGLLSMLSVLDHPGFIGRALRATQQSKAKPSHTAQQHHATGQDDQVRDHETDVDKWMVFCDTFQKDIENINLLATVLLTANFSFLAIQSIDQSGLSYWPQRLSYASLLSAMGSILMGLAVRSPRFFTAYSKSYFQTMVLVLGFPFELFLYSVFFFIAALVVHFAIHAATFQFAAATLIFLLVFVCLGLYWHVTEPQEKELLCSWVSQSRDVEAAIAI